MSTIRLVIAGNVPSQKNNKEIAVRHDGSRFVRSNDRVKQWQQDALPQVNMQRKYEAESVSCIALTFYFDNKRRHDLDNAASGVMDVLVKSGILRDDCVDVVDDLRLKYGGIDKQNPRVEIVITE